jgi:hypothetical protein
MHTQLPLRLPAFDEKTRYPAIVAGKIRKGSLIRCSLPGKGEIGINTRKTAPETPAGQAGKTILRKRNPTVQYNCRGRIYR